MTDKPASGTPLFDEMAAQHPDLDLAGFAGFFADNDADSRADAPPFSEPNWSQPGEHPPA